MNNQQGMYLFLSQEDVLILKRALGTRFERVKKISARQVRESECEGIRLLRNRIDKKLERGWGNAAKIIS